MLVSVLRPVLCDSGLVSWPGTRWMDELGRLGQGKKGQVVSFPFFYLFFFIEATLNVGCFRLQYLRRWMRFIWVIPHLMDFFFSFVSFSKFILYRLISPWEDAICRRSDFFWHEKLLLNSQVIGSLHVCVYPVPYKISTISNNCKSV